MGGTDTVAVADFEGAAQFREGRIQASPACFELADGGEDTTGQIASNNWTVMNINGLSQLNCDDFRHKSDDSSKVGNALHVKVLQLKTVSCHTSSDSAVLMNGIKLSTQLTAGLAEGVFRHSIPQPGIVSGCGLALIKPAANNADFINVIRYRVADGVSQLRRDS